MSIKQKIVKGGFLLALANIFSQLLAVIVNIILARLLLPRDFGLIALATTYIGLITMFTNIGFGSAIIQKQQSTEGELSTLYWINFILSMFTFSIVVFTAQFASNFYSEPELSYIVWLAAVNILLTPFFITHYKIKERDLEFKLLTIIAIISTITGAIAAVITAFAGFGVYSLVVQILVFTVTRLFSVLYSSNWKPRLIFSYNDVKGMVWYSIKFKASETVLYLERNIDYLILGKVCSSIVLGYYAFAYNIMYTPVKRVSYIFNDVLFPSFSAMKDEPLKIVAGYFKSIQLIAMITFPAMALLAFNAEWAIQTVFGPKWNEAIPIVQILCFAGAIQSISQVGGVVFSSIGKPEVNLYVAIPRTALTVLAILIGSFYNLTIIAYLLVIAKGLSLIMMLSMIYAHIHYSITKLFNYLAGPISCIVVLVITQYVFIKYHILSSTFQKLTIMSAIAFLIIAIFHYKTIKQISDALRDKALG